MTTHKTGLENVFAGVVTPVLLLSAGLTVQLYLYYQFSLKRMGLFPIFMSSLVLVAMLLASAAFCARRGLDVRNHILSSVFVLFLGPIGTFIALMEVAFLALFTKKLKGDFSEWIYRYLFEVDPRQRKSDDIYSRIISGQESADGNIDTEPLVDIMEFGSISQKQEALVKVVKYFRPNLTPVIRMGLNDPNNAVRVQAAAALAKLQDDFHRKYNFYEQRIIDGTESAEELLSFARICGEYLDSGLMPSTRREEAVKESIRLYERCIGLYPDSLELKTALIRMHLIDGGTDAANALLDDVLEHVSDPEPALAYEIMELLFKLGRFLELRRLAKEWTLSGKMNSDDAVMECLEFWGALSGKGAALGERRTG